jgi:hypothetical protein
VARLSNQDPSRVVCSNRKCGLVFGRIADAEGKRRLFMEPGWIEAYDKSVWYRPEHLEPSIPAIVYEVVFFPVQAICPDCGAWQFLHGKTLQLQGLPREKLELRPWTQDPFKRHGWRPRTGKGIGEKEAKELLENS